MNSISDTAAENIEKAAEHLSIIILQRGIVQDIDPS